MTGSVHRAFLVDSERCRGMFAAGLKWRYPHLSGCLHAWSRQ